MSGSTASVFEGPAGIIPVVNTAGNIYEEVQVATAGKTVFVLTTFQYTPGTKTIIVLKNGVELRRAVGYTETNNTTVTLAAGAALNDVLTFRAYAIGTLTAPLQNNGVIPAGTAGQVLAKIDATDYNLQWLSLSSIATLLDQPRQNVASAPTVDLTPYAATSRNILITGTTQIDGFAITNGQTFILKFASALTLSNNASLVTGAGQAIKIAPNDSCIIRATADNIVEVVSFSRGSSSLQVNYSDHRLTLTTATPVTIIDVTGAGTVYMTAYKGNKISLFNGVSWIVRETNEVSIVLGGLAVNRPYDVFAYDNAGTVTLELAAWSTNTVRNFALVRQDGVWVKSTDLTRKFIGTLFTTAAATTEDSQTNRYLWNMYNRVPRYMVKAGDAGNWNLAGPAANFRQANNSVNNQVSFVAGLAEDSIATTVMTAVTTNIAGNGYAYVGVSIDVTTAFNFEKMCTANSSATTPITASGMLAPQLGKHNIVWVEQNAGASTATFYGLSDGQINATIPA